MSYGLKLCALPRVVALICGALWVGMAAMGQAQGAPELGNLQTISPNEAKENLTTFVQPEYPPLAKATGIMGIVRASVVIDEMGGVKNLKLISGHPMLAPSALESIRKWKYKPFQVDGKPVAVRTEVEVSIPEKITQSDIDQERQERKFQDTYWLNAREGREALKKGDFAKTDAKLHVAQVAAEERGAQKWLELADVITALADSKSQQTDYAEAESLLKQSLSIHQKHQRRDEAEVAGAEFKLAALYVQMHRQAEAEPLLLESARVWELRLAKAPPPEAKNSYGWHLALSYFAAAQIAAENGRVEEAQSRCRKAITFSDEVPKDDSMDAIRSRCESLLQAD